VSVRQVRPGTIITPQKDFSTVVNMYLPHTSFGGGDESKSIVYASVHPFEGEGFDQLVPAVERLALNDTGLEVQTTSGNSNNEGGPYLGPGLRVGFQGLLHVEVFRQRLVDEHGLEAIVTPPKVPYRITYLQSKNRKISVDAPETETIEDLSKWLGQGFRFKVENRLLMSQSWHHRNLHSQLEEVSTYCNYKVICFMTSYFFLFVLLDK